MEVLKANRYVRLISENTADHRTVYIFEPTEPGGAPMIARAMLNARIEQPAKPQRKFRTSHPFTAVALWEAIDRDKLVSINEELQALEQRTESVVVNVRKHLNEHPPGEEDSLHNEILEALWRANAALHEVANTIDTETPHGADTGESEDLESRPPE